MKTSLDHQFKKKNKEQNSYFKSVRHPKQIQLNDYTELQKSGREQLSEASNNGVKETQVLEDVPQHKSSGSDRTGKPSKYPKPGVILCLPLL